MYKNKYICIVFLSPHIRKILEDKEFFCSLLNKHLDEYMSASSGIQWEFNDFFFFVAALHSTKYLSSPTRDGTRALCSGSMDS